MHPKYPLLIVMALVSGVPAFANGPFIPDPPGTADFKSVNLRTAAPGPHKVTTACDPAYREAVETGFAAVWGECAAIGKNEPSDCQRALFASCTKSANEMRARQGATCAVMAGSASAIAGAGSTALTQNNSEAKNSVVNKDGAAAARKVADRLEADAAAIGTAVSDAGKTVKGALCAISSSSETYAQSQAKIDRAFAGVQGKLKDLASARRSLANGYDGTAKASDTNVAAMVSANPTTASGPGSASSPFAGVSSDSAGSSPANKALPLVGAALPAAVLTGVALNNGGLGGTSPDNPVPGAAEMRRGAVSVSGNLTDKQRAMVALAVQRLPECQRRKLNGVPISAANLNPGGVRRDPRGCVAGLWSPKGGNRAAITLDPNCGISVGVVSHELYHQIGHYDGQALHQVYRRAYSAYGNCPVSNYGATNFVEDFAEAGRLGSIPDNDRRSGGCVSAKVSELSSAVKGCR